MRTAFAAILLLAASVSSIGQGAGRMAVVPSISALTNRPASMLEPVVFLAGRTNYRDFPGAVLVYSSSATDAVDWTNAFPTVSGAGRWLAYPVAIPASSGGILDSPVDTTMYARKDGAWENIYSNNIIGLNGWMDLKANVDHKHVAADITNGVMASERLGTGTPTTNTYLRGSGSGLSAAWSTIPSAPSATNGIPDAPSDGVLYGRLSGAWTGVDIGLVSGITPFGSSWLQDISTGVDGRNALGMVGVSAATIDSPAKFAVRRQTTGSGYTRHRLNVIAGNGISSSLVDDSIDDEQDLTLSVSDGDRGDISVSGSGATWSVDAAAISYSKIQDVAASRLLGRGSASGSGPPQEVSIGSGLAMSGTILAADQAPHNDAVANLLLVTTSEVSDSNHDSTYRDVTPSARSGMSATVTGGTVLSGTVLKIEVAGVMDVGASDYDPAIKMVFDGPTGSDYSIEFILNEPGSTYPSDTTTWKAEATVVVATAGSPATARQRSFVVWSDGSMVGSGSLSGYGLMSGGTSSNSLDTAVDNTFKIYYKSTYSGTFGAAMVDFKVTSVIIWIL